MSSDDKETPTNPEKEPESNPKPDVAAACQSKPRDKRPTSAIELIKEDFGLFKQDVLKIFRDKDAKTSNVKDKTALNVLKDDLDLFKSEITTFTDDISGILRKGLRKEDNLKIKAKEQNKEQRQETEKEDSVERKANEEVEQKGEDGKENNEEEQSGDESLETKTQEQNERGESAKDSCKIEEQKSADADVGKDDSEDCANDTEKESNGEEFCVDGWEVVEFEQNDRTSTGNVNEDETEPERSDRGDGGSKMSDADVSFTEDESVPRSDHLISLSSGVGLLRLRHVAKNQQRRVEFKDDIWAIKNFAQYLTLDPNTANPELVLSDGNRTARREWSGGHVTVQPSDHMTEHPERFEHCPQVLCREGLLDAVYWEVQWTGGADVGVAYNSLSRRGPAAEGLLGQSETSWSLECSRGSYTPCHRRRRYKSVCPEPFSQTVGVFLDFAAGALSFFCISPGSMQHLHTFSAAFTEPLYPGFWLWSWGGSVSLSQVELGWERLLQ